MLSKQMEKIYENILVGPVPFNNIIIPDLKLITISNIYTIFLLHKSTFASLTGGLLL